MSQRLMARESVDAIEGGTGALPGYASLEVVLTASAIACYTASAGVGVLERYLLETRASEHPPGEPGVAPTGHAPPATLRDRPSGRSVCDPIM